MFPRRFEAQKISFFIVFLGRDIGINRVLMVCDKNNIGSAKSILNNDGILENEVLVDGIVEQRYWIDID